MPERLHGGALVLTAPGDSTAMNTAIPTVAQLRPYIAGEECYLVAEELEAVFAGLRATGGFYVHARSGRPSDHGWCVAADSTIVDTTHRQFVASRPIVVAVPGSRLHRRYHSWSEHHPANDPTFCLFRALGVSYECSRATDEPWLSLCDYYGRENPGQARQMAARNLASHRESGRRKSAAGGAALL